MTNNPEPYFMYPLGKILPIVQNLSDFLFLNSTQISKNLEQASDEHDFDKLIALTKLINYWKNCQVHYLMPETQRNIFGWIRADFMILNAFGKLDRTNNQSNRKVHALLGQILSFFYRQFKSIDLKDYSIHINNLIIFLQRSQWKRNKEASYDQAYIRVVQDYFLKWIVFLQPFDGVNKDIFRETIQSQSNQMIQAILSSTELSSVFVEAFVLLRLQFLGFFENHCENEWEQFQEESNRAQLVRQIKYGSSYVPDEFPVFQTSAHFLFMLVIFSKNHSSTPKIQFALIRPIIHYLSKLMSLYQSQQEKQYFFNKIFRETFKLLLQLYSDQQKNYDEQSISIKQKNDFQFIKGLLNTTLLTDLQIALVCIQEEQIREHKEKSRYHNQYQQILQYFREVEAIKQLMKRKMQKHFQRLIFTPQQLKAIKLKAKQKQNQRKLKVCQKTNPLLQASISLPKNQTDCLSPNKNKNQRNYISEEKYLQSSSKKNEFKKSLRIPKLKNKMDENKNKNTLKLEEQDTQYYDEQSFEQKNKVLTNSFSSAKFQSGQNVRSGANFKQPEYKQDQNDRNNINKASQATKNQQNTPHSNQIPAPKGKDFFYQIFVTYYQQFYHPYQAIDIFREKIDISINLAQNLAYDKQKEQSKKPLENQYQIKYPFFMNTGFYHPQTKRKQTFKAKIFEIKIHKNIENFFLEKKLKIKSSLEVINSVNSARRTQKINQRNKNCQQLLEDTLKLNQISERTKTFAINMFPLSQTLIGMNALRMLARYLQQFMEKLTQKLDKNQEQKQKFNQNLSTHNPFNVNSSFQSRPRNASVNSVNGSSQKIQSPPDIFSTKIFYLKSYLKTPYLFDIDLMRDDQASQYCFSLIYDVLLHFKQLESYHEDIMAFFYTDTFVQMNKALQSMFIYYIYEFDRKAYWNLQKTLSKFTRRYLTTDQLLAVLKCFILDIKLQNKEMNFVYFSLYKILTQNVLDLISNFDEIIFRQLLYHLDDFHKRGRQSPKRTDIETSKRDLKVQFEQFAELNYLWQIMTLGVSRYSANRDYNLKYNQEQQTKNVAFYCPNCTSIGYMRFSDKVDDQFQDPYCQLCVNSLLYRFQLHQCDEKFINQADQSKIKVDYEMKMQLAKIQKEISTRKWHINRLNYHKFEQNCNDIQQQDYYDKEMQIEQTFQMRIQRKNDQKNGKYHNLHKEVNQAGRNQKNRDEDNKKQRKNKEKKKNGKVRSSQNQIETDPQQEAIKQNEQYIFNMMGILKHYLKYSSYILT